VSIRRLEISKERRVVQPREPAAKLSFSLACGNCFGCHHYPLPAPLILAEWKRLTGIVINVVNYRGSYKGCRETKINLDL
jgi:hypothetical protein